ncbi:MAG: hypothetical protein IJC63_08690, partial [Myxococcaceae bacterium]|nr:hypothetical protein [Myxococcaceae bacterium]
FISIAKTFAGQRRRNLVISGGLARRGGRDFSWGFWGAPHFYAAAEECRRKPGGVARFVEIHRTKTPNKQPN